MPFLSAQRPLIKAGFKSLKAPLKQLWLPFLAVLALCVFSYFYIDRLVLSWLSTHTPPALRLWANWADLVGDAQNFLIPAAFVSAVALWLGWGAFPGLSLTVQQKAKSLAFKALYVLSSLLATGFVVNVLKVLIGRHRPEHYLKEGLYGFSPISTQHILNSFPSGHSQAVFTAMLCLSLLYPKGRALFLTVAVLLASSRLVCLAHYPSDVLMGSFLGAAGAIVGFKLYQKVYQQSLGKEES